MRISFIEKMCYEKGKNLSFEEAKTRSLLFLEYAQRTREWREDEGYFCDYWYGFADNWDLNIFYPEPDEFPDHFRMSIYPVSGEGETDYNVYRTVYPPEDEDLGEGELPLT